MVASDRVCKPFRIASIEDQMYLFITGVNHLDAQLDIVPIVPIFQFLIHDPCWFGFPLFELFVIEWHRWSWSRFKLPVINFDFTFGKNLNLWKLQREVIQCIFYFWMRTNTDTKLVPCIFINNFYEFLKPFHLRKLICSQIRC